jgi:copper chaperone
MSCQHCVNAITGELTKLTGVAEVVVDLGDKAVTVRGTGLDDLAVRSVIDEAGYTTVG